jgi:hypothetical protein
MNGGCLFGPIALLWFAMSPQGAGRHFLRGKLLQAGLPTRMFPERIIEGMVGLALDRARLATEFQAGLKNRPHDSILTNLDAILDAYVGTLVALGEKRLSLEDFQMQQPELSAILHGK